MITVSLCLVQYGSATQIMDRPILNPPARVVYVSNAGSDDGPGTSAAPWRTLARVATESWRGGDTIMLTSGDVWEESLIMNNRGGGDGTNLIGFLDSVISEGEAPQTFAIRGWAVNCDDGKTHTTTSCGMARTHPALAPSKISVVVDGIEIGTYVANLSRPDLVDAGVAPDPFHGFNIVLNTTMQQRLQQGLHRVNVYVVGCGSACGIGDGWTVPQSPKCVCNGSVCDCKKVPGPVAPPLVVRATDVDGVRPKILFTDGPSSVRNESNHWGVMVTGVASVTVSSVFVQGFTAGLLVGGVGNDGDVVVNDCVFKGIWNRSSIGQTHTGNNPCANGWTQSVLVGHLASATITNNLFDDFDVAFQPMGTIDTIRFIGNTMTGGNGNVVFFTASHDWLLSQNVFSRDDAPRYFTCGTTDIMIGGIDSRGNISENEIGWRGEHPASPDGCGIDYEGGSDGVTVSNNLIHDSYGGGVMVFGMSDRSRNISNASILNNIFIRNGGQQTSSDRGEIALCQHGSTGVIEGNTFFAMDTNTSFIFNETPGFGRVLPFGWRLNNNTVFGVSAVPTMVSPTPAIGSVVYGPSGATLTLTPRAPYKHIEAIMWTTDGSWPQRTSASTHVMTTTFVPPNHLTNNTIVVTRTVAVNVRYIFTGLIDSLTMTMVVPFPNPQ